LASTPGGRPTAVSLPGVMVCLMLGPLINILDYNVVNVALPKMMSGLATDILTIRWVVTASLIATAVVMPTLGWVGRTLGNKRLYVLGLAVFTGASILCGMAPNAGVLVALRALQGLGAGVLMPISLVLVLEVYPPEKRGMGTALWGIGASMGSVIGLPLGGYFADAIDWRAVFYVNLLPGTLAVLLTLMLVPAATREEPRPFDVWGFLTLSVALVSLLVAVSDGQREGWSSPFILLLLALSSGALGLFFLIEWRTPAPLLDLRLYTSLRYISSTLIALAMGVFFYASTFLIVLFAQLLLDLSVQDTAMALLPGSIAMVLTSPLVGWTIDRSEPRLAMLLGLALYAVSCYLMIRADLRIGFMFLVWVYIFRGLGLGFLYPPVFVVATSGLPQQRTRAASSLLNLWVVLGGTFSIALFSTLVEWRQTLHQARYAETQVLTSAGTQQALALFGQLASTLGAGMVQAELYARGVLQGLVRREALVRALNDGFALILFITLCSVGILLTMRMTRRK
jgi:MFS transporter, DHA2 family, multidrug resistance protein